MSGFDGRHGFGRGHLGSKCGACGARARKRARVVLIQGKSARAVWACAGCFRDSVAFLFVGRFA